LAITHPTQAALTRDPTIAQRNPPAHPHEAGEYAEPCYRSRKPIIPFCIKTASAIKEARSTPIGGSARVLPGLLHHPA
jgi:hypothetical protein